MDTYNIINCENIISYHFAYFYVIIEYFEMFLLLLLLSDFIV